LLDAQPTLKRFYKTQRLLAWSVCPSPSIISSNIFVPASNSVQSRAEQLNSLSSVLSSVPIDPIGVYLHSLSDTSPILSRILLKTNHKLHRCYDHTVDHTQRKPPVVSFARFVIFVLILMFILICWNHFSAIFAMKPSRSLFCCSNLEKLDDYKMK
jgi:hypothetical protein